MIECRATGGILFIWLEKLAFSYCDRIWTLRISTHDSMKDGISPGSWPVFQTVWVARLVISDIQGTTGVADAGSSAVKSSFKMYLSKSRSSHSKFHLSRSRN